MIEADVSYKGSSELVEVVQSIGDAHHYIFYQDTQAKVITLTENATSDKDSFFYSQQSISYII